MTQVSIKTKLLGIVGILCVLAFAYTISGLVDSIKKSYQSQKIVTASEVSRELLRTLLGVRLERGSALYLLDAESVSDPYWSGIIEGYRSKSEAGYTAITTLLEGQTASEVTDAMDKVKTTHDRVVKSRGEVDAAARMPKSQRDPAMSAKMTTVLRDYLDVLTKATNAVDKVIQTADAQIDQYLAVKRAAWIARVAAGGIAGRIQATISIGKPWSLAEAIEAAEERGFAKRAWDSMNEIIGAGTLSPRVMEAYTKANAMNFIGQAAEERKSFSEALSNGRIPDVALKDLQARDTQNQQAIVDLAYAALDELVDRALAIQADARLGLIQCSALLAGALAMAAFSFYVIFRGIAGPLKLVARCVGELASGNLETQIPFVGRTDEIGGIVSAVAVFKERLLRNRELEEEADRTRLEGERQRKKIVSDLAVNFEASVGDIVRSVVSSATNLETAARAMSNSAVETSERSTAVAAAAGQAAANVTMVAASAEELGASVNEISRRVLESSEMAGAAVKEATETANIVRELSQSAGRINDVVALISTIAGQTNLLALNATIEAARAGEAGRGFAVVAAEVKELANQTAKATSEISEQVNSIQASTERAVTAIGAITSTIGMLNEGATLISSSIAEQGSATGEIVRNIGHASSGTSTVTDNISGVARAAAQSGSAAEEVLSSSAELAKKAEQMRIQVDNFVGSIRSA